MILEGQRKPRSFIRCEDEGPGHLLSMKYAG